MSDLGAHLAEMDRMLRDIQIELAPEREPRPALTPDAVRPPAPKGVTRARPARSAEREHPPDRPLERGDRPLERAPERRVDQPAEPDPQLEAMADLAARLVASMRELLDGYEGLVARTSPSIPRGGAQPSGRAAAPSWARSRPATEPPGSQVTLSAGPFGSIEALREFEHAVSRLRGVREVTVQGYQGADRALIEVRLDPLSP